MIKLTMTRVAVGIAGLALSATAGAGVASATPDLGPAVNTTCTYPQLMAALNAADPVAASVFNSNDAMKAGLQQFLAAPPDTRQRMAQQIAASPENQPYIGLYQTVFNTCNNF
ncbi:hypothetical protein A5790_20975 [Mycobacterium sp. 852002-51152_SCH6134967]|uniref:hemophore-related protein n=1 Tax=Mycobacterium sp. 852002-51152_SCH6134967 TaxID=1834096 RepID=UPI0007FD5116|nr:hemophore-related protein [Mycobacterium sp. 852002-51152_SCH6134967]OBF89135.1 hypothetical protein A5790_20975 [Mycobacterium sp. 852002-51152_SCH6134967]